MNREEVKKYAGVEEDVIIYHLHYCFIEKGMSYVETRKYFTEVLRLEYWTINPYLNTHPHIVSVWAEGEDTSREYIIDDLPDLKKRICLTGG